MTNYMKELKIIPLSLQRKYRSYIEIIASILDAIKYKEATRYSIMQRASINHKQLKKYLESLAKAGFVEVYKNNGRVLYKASEVGLIFLRQYNLLQDMLFNAYFQKKAVNVVLKNSKYLR